MSHLSFLSERWQHSYYCLFRKYPLRDRSLHTWVCLFGGREELFPMWITSWLSDVKMKLLKIKGKIKIYFLQCTFGRLQNKIKESQGTKQIWRDGLESTLSIYNRLYFWRSTLVLYVQLSTAQQWGTYLDPKLVWGRSKLGRISSARSGQDSTGRMHRIKRKRRRQNTKNTNILEMGISGKA